MGFSMNADSFSRIAVSDEESDNQVEPGMNNALAQFLQVFQEAHARQFRSFGHRRPGPVHKVSHDG